VSDSQGDAGNAWRIDPETGLLLFPPPTYADGSIRRRLCRRCKTRKTVADFAPIIHWTDTPFSVAGVYRRRTCKQCRRDQERIKNQRRKGKAQRKTLATYAKQLDHDAEDIHAVRQFLDQLAEELGGTRDWQQMTELWARYLNDPKTPLSRKITAFHVFHFARLLADQADLERLRREQPDFATIDHAAYVQWLAERGQLTGLLRAALADGLITLDDIDPPPAWTE
jgi:hypothetical protein